MSNFDDIFNPKPKVDGPSFTSFNKDEWAAQKKKDREQAYALIDTTVQRMAADGSLFQTYLDVQSRFDRYSVGNAVLITAQLPEANKLADFKTWKESDVYIKKGETGITILEPGEEYTREDGSIGVSYNAKKVFDVSQTNARQQKPPMVSHDPKILLQALIHNAPCEVKISNQLPDNVGAVYKQEEKVIMVRQGMEFADIFRSLSQELAHAHMDKGGYKRSECAFAAYSTSYILCKRYGVPTDYFRFDRMPEGMSSMDAQTIRGELGRIRDVANDISTNMTRVLEPRERSTKTRSDGAR